LLVAFCIPVVAAFALSITSKEGWGPFIFIVFATWWAARGLNQKSYFHPFNPTGPLRRIFRRLKPKRRAAAAPSGNPETPESTPAAGPA
jgi:hypothetical protein